MKVQYNLTDKEGVTLGVYSPEFSPTVPNVNDVVKLPNFTVYGIVTRVVLHVFERDLYAIVYLQECLSPQCKEEA